MVGVEVRLEVVTEVGSKFLIQVGAPGCIPPDSLPSMPAGATAVEMITDLCRQTCADTAGAVAVESGSNLGAPHCDPVTVPDPACGHAWCRHRAASREIVVA
ncbi:hypothetical protein GCM10027186_17760 [Micromonospora schwarzwaldensis]